MTFDDFITEPDRPRTRAEAWADLVSMAAKKKAVYQTALGPVELAKGDVLISGRILAKRWGWNLSTVQRFLAALTGMGRITGRTMGRNLGRTPSVYRVEGTPTYTPKPATNGSHDGSQLGSQNESRISTSTRSKIKSKDQEQDQEQGQEQDQNQDQKLANEQARSAKPLGGWTAELARRWAGMKGYTPPGRIGKALGHAVLQHGVETVWDVCRDALETAKSQGRLGYVTPEYVAANFTALLAGLGDTDTDADGIPTASYYRREALAVRRG